MKLLDDIRNRDDRDVSSVSVAEFVCAATRCAERTSLEIAYKNDGLEAAQNPADIDDQIDDADQESE